MEIFFPNDLILLIILRKSKTMFIKIIKKRVVKYFDSFLLQLVMKMPLIMRWNIIFNKLDIFLINFIFVKMLISMLILFLAYLIVAYVFIIYIFIYYYSIIVKRNHTISYFFDWVKKFPGWKSNRKPLV